MVEDSLGKLQIQLENLEIIGIKDHQRQLAAKKKEIEKLYRERD